MISVKTIYSHVHYKGSPQHFWCCDSRAAFYSAQSARWLLYKVQPDDSWKFTGRTVETEEQAVKWLVGEP